MGILVDKATNEVIVEELRIANSFFARFKGLMFKKEIKEGEGLLLTKTKQIHTFWMLTKIDVLYLRRISDREYRIVNIQAELSPWRIGIYNKNVTDIIELRAGKIEKAQIKKGDEVTIK